MSTSRLCVALVLVSGFLFSQTEKPSKEVRKETIKLEVKKQQTIFQDVEGVGLAARACDSKSNLYFYTSSHHDEAIFKFDTSAEKVSAIDFLAPELQKFEVYPWRFTVTSNGHLYVRAALPRGKERGLYIVEFDSDGKFKTTTKLQGFFGVVHVGVFPTGEFLIVGHNTVDKNLRKGYFTAIFNSSGQLLRYVDMQTDARTEELTQSGDPNYANSSTPVPLDRTFELGHTRSLDDGNVYFLRRTSPATIYAINSGGEVVRTLTVDGGSNMFPSDFEYSNGYFLIAMHDPDKPAAGIFKIVAAVTGEEFAAIQVDNIGLAFTCYEAPATLKALTVVGKALVVKSYGPVD
jgi:hypothetical protein